MQRVRKKKEKKGEKSYPHYLHSLSPIRAKICVCCGYIKSICISMCPEYYHLPCFLTEACDCKWNK